MVLYEKFAELLAKNNVNAHQVSQATGISTATLTSWKQGVYTPKIEKLMLIAKHFDVPITYFIEDK